MNHINYRRYSLIAISLISLCFFSACDEDAYEEKTIGNEAQKVYLSNGIAPMNFMDLTVVFNPSEVPDKVEYKVPVRITSPLSKDVTVTLEMDNLETVTTYNTLNGTNYALPVEGTYEFTKSSATIKAGDYVSKDSACLTLSNFTAMNLSGKYLFPIKLKEVSDAQVVLSTNMNHMYCALVNNCINVDPGDSELGDGHFIADRSQWSAQSMPNDYTRYLFDADDGSKWYPYGENFTLIIDLKKELTFSGIAMRTVKAWNYAANVKNVDIYTSENRIDWSLVGSKLFPQPSTVKDNIVKFYSPITTQYIKLYFPDSYYYESSYNEYTIGISEFNLIEWTE